MMLAGMKSASAALSRHERVQEVSAQNLANTVTPGYKRVSLAFGELMEREASSQSENGRQTVVVDFSQGALIQTENPLDLAIKGDAFFTVRDPKTGEIRYTRNGSFSLNTRGELETRDGAIVLGQNGPISMGRSVKRIEIDRNGVVRADNANVGRLRLDKVLNPETLRPAGKTSFTPDPSRTKVTRAEDSAVLQGQLEVSNVNPITEMVTMLANLRQFEACNKSLGAIQNSAGKLFQTI